MKNIQFRNLGRFLKAALVPFFFSLVTVAHFILDVIKALAWPAIVVFLLWAFWRPLQETAAVIPSLLSRSETITIGAVSVAVKQRNLMDRATSEMRAVLRKLTAHDIRAIIEVSWEVASTEIPLPGDNPELQAMKKQWDRFAELGLATIESSKEPKRAAYRIVYKPVFHQTRVFLIDLMADLIEEANALQEQNR